MPSDARDVQLSQVLIFDSIVWISSPAPDELGLERRILEDLNILHSIGGLPVLEYRPQNRTELINVFEQIVTRMVRRGTRPIVHFHMHGSARDGLVLNPSGEFCPWAVVADELRCINLATGNQLLTIFGTCHAYHLGKQADPKRLTFSNMMIAPERQIGWGFLQDRVIAFYRTLNETSSITDAFESALKEQMTLFYAEAMLFKALVKYVREQSSGKAKLERRERLLTRVLNRHDPSTVTPDEIRQARRKIKARLGRLDETIVERFAESFLLRQSCGFSIDDVIVHATRSAR